MTTKIPVPHPHADPAKLPRTGILGPRIHVDPAMVHKHSFNEALVASYQMIDEEHMFTLIVPATHSMAAHDTSLPLIIGVESIRQIGLALCHLHGAVPLGWAFILQRVSFEWLRMPPRVPVEAPLRLTARCRIDVEKFRRGVLSEVSASTVIWEADGILARGSGDIRCFHPNTYRALRRHAPVQSGACNRPSTHSVVTDLRKDEGVATGVLGWPYPHPFFFDHDVDHVPGMLMVAAAIRMHYEAVGREPRGIDLSCTRYAELDTSLEIAARPGSGTVLTSFRQRDHELAMAETTM